MSQTKHTAYALPATPMSEETVMYPATFNSNRIVPLSTFTNGSPAHPAFRQQAYRQTPSSVGKRIGKSLIGTLLAYLPLKWALKSVGIKAPKFWMLFAGLFGFHSLKHLLHPAALPIKHRLNIAA